MGRVSLCYTPKLSTNRNAIKVRRRERAILLSSSVDSSIRLWEIPQDCIAGGGGRGGDDPEELRWRMLSKFSWGHGGHTDTVQSMVGDDPEELRWRMLSNRHMGIFLGPWGAYRHGAEYGRR